MNITQPTRAVLLHLSFNMWGEADSPDRETRRARPYLRFDEALWKELTQRMADHGLNMVVLDLGDGVKYDSHPEIAVDNAWSPERLKEESQRLKEMGIELIPKLNFSTSHDAWLGEYARCVSTPAYYKVCQELIEEVCVLLDTPRFFHLGMDEETAGHQKNYNYAVMRQYDLWWHDALFLFEQVEKQGSRPWVWSDYIWNHKEEYLKRMPKNVLQSNWYYGQQFDFEPSSEQPVALRVDAYRALNDHGYDQIPTCSNHGNRENTALTVEFARQNIAADKLKGFLQTPWRPTIQEYKDHLIESIDLLGKALG